MKAIFNKILLGAVMAAGLGLSSCVGDLDQLPRDPSTIMAPTFAENPRYYVGELMGKCYMGLAVSGQNGPDSDADIKGVDGGMSQWSRSMFHLNEFTTDEMWWIYYNENGFDGLLNGNWAADSDALYSAYSRYYCHISVCNDFLRTMNSLASNGVQIGGEGENAISQAEIDQFCREARALRALSYFNVIDFWGRGCVAWDNQEYGQIPPQAESRQSLYQLVVSDLEDVYNNWPDNQSVVYGRIGKEAVAGLLCRYYLNEKVFTNNYEDGAVESAIYSGADGWTKCWNMAQTIIRNHEGNNRFGGLVPSYLSVFCSSNSAFMPGGSNSQLNEILWGVPFNETYTQPYGGTTYLTLAPVIAGASNEIGQNFCDPSYFGLGNAWGCLGMRSSLADKFDFVDGYSTDARTYLWMTSAYGYTNDLSDIGSYSTQWHPIKFTNLYCNPDGTMPLWQDSKTGLNRAGVRLDGDNVECTTYYSNTDLPIIRLADVYLMAAECAVNGASGSSLADAMKYINYVRSRANATPLTSTAEVTKNFILDERSRELYMECVRRTDLIRNDQFTSNYNWPYKGGVAGGAPLESTRTLFPFPTNVVAVYGSAMVQNAGY